MTRITSKLKISLTAIAFIWGMGMALAQNVTAGPSDDCDNLPSGTTCGPEPDVTCCSYFENGIPVDEEKGELQLP